MSTQNKRAGSRLVYSDDPAQYCQKCKRLKQDCQCRPERGPVDMHKAVVRVGRETKGRKGKGVTVVSGIPLPEQELRQLARELKQRCGCGGTLKNGIIEIQGDQRDLLLEVLRQQGWNVKRSGG